MTVLSAAAKLPRLVEINKIETKKIFDAADTDWLQMQIDLTARETGAKSYFQNKFLRDVGIKATLAYKVGKTYHFFQSELKIAALEANKKKNIYFYMPGDIVKMYKLPKKPEYYYISVTVGSTKLPPRKDFLSSSLSSGFTPDKLKSFLTKAESEAKRNEGIFLPITKAPYWVVQTGRVDFKKLPCFLDDKKK